MTLLIDNYDSFSYNLYQAIGGMDEHIKVIRNDEMDVEGIFRLKPQRIILSPGPGRCEDAGICIEVIQKLGPAIPILGVCLGHQAICTAYQAVVSHAKQLVHGKTSIVEIDVSSPIFKGLDVHQKVARYHSLAVIEETIPSVLRITARAEDGQIMAVQHTTYPIYGVQFHPESIMTEHGQEMLENFMNIQGETR
ncbi:MAG: aminodeoxychorismate/anthranilate synthase component II [Sphaerochaeta sp.]|nr:aminodeoxychorismate/anthranilate synthase component II [Sphaerochaeta sp.]